MWGVDAMEIYYFSGTGNSLTVAKDIAQGTGANLAPITSALQQTQLAPSRDAIGIVFPVYYGRPPVIVQQFAARLENLQGKYVFAVCTFGGAAMASLRTLRNIIHSRGGRLAAEFGVHMPQNSFFKAKENQAELCSRWKSQLPQVVDLIRNRARGTFYVNRALELLFIPLQHLVIDPLCRRDFAKLAGVPGSAGLPELIHQLDRGFFTDDRCTGCGICAAVCPVGNILLTEQRPAWQHRCENCLACYNWCPQKAIRGGITKGHFYRHPAVKLPEMLVEPLTDGRRLD